MADFYKKPYPYNQSVEKGLKILELLSEQGGLRDKEISNRLETNIITVRQLLQIYQEYGYITRDREGYYDLSIKIIDISQKFRQRSEIKNIAHSHLAMIAHKYNETTILGTLEKTDIIYLDKIDSMELLRFAPQTEQRITAHHTALGKSILAHLPIKELNQYCYHAPWRAITPKTITTREKLLIRLRQVRKQGFAICDEEYCLGLRGIAVAILDAMNYPRFSISIWGPTSRMTPQKLRKMQIDLTEASLDISNYYAVNEKEDPQIGIPGALTFSKEMLPAHEPGKEKKNFLERTLAFFL